MTNLPPLASMKSYRDGRDTRAGAWWQQQDKLCVLAVILALLGIFPHAVDALARLVGVLRGIPAATAAVPTPVATPPPR